MELFLSIVTILPLTSRRLREPAQGSTAAFKLLAASRQTKRLIILTSRSFYLTLTLRQASMWLFRRLADLIVSSYRVHEFAERAGVTVKALHHYRIYVDRDLERLEQIVALKFIGLPLKQIKALLDRDTLQLPAALRLQRAELEDKRRLLDRAIAAIANAEKALQSGKPADAGIMKKIIEVIDMQGAMPTGTEFMKNYYREEAWARFQERHRVWPSEAWSDLFRDISGSLHEDPASEKAQALARRWRALRVSDAGGDPRIHGGLINAWADREYWPEAAQQRLSEFDLHEISAFIVRVFASYRQRNYGDLAVAKELDQFAPEDRERPPLVSASLYFTIAESLDEDPAGEKAQALVARWMELVESRTGFKTPSNADYEALVQRIQKWPSAFTRQLYALDRERISAFILNAMAQGGTAEGR
jgi:MerR family transcriptional regulator, thiopeptide resistance regulator